MHVQHVHSLCRHNIILYRTNCLEASTDVSWFGAPRALASRRPSVMGRMFLDGSLPRPDLREVNRNTARLLTTIEALTSPSLKTSRLPASSSRPSDSSGRDQMAICKCSYQVWKQKG